LLLPPPARSPPNPQLHQLAFSPHSCPGLRAAGWGGSAGGSCTGPHTGDPTEGPARGTPPQRVHQRAPAQDPTKGTPQRVPQRGLAAAHPDGPFPGPAGAGTRVGVPQRWDLRPHGVKAEGL